MKVIKYIILAAIINTLSSCANDNEALIPSNEDLFPAKSNSEIDTELRELFGAYNTVVEYRYIKNFLDKDWYHITPVQEDLVVPMCEFLMDFWVKNIEAGSSNEFVVNNFPKKIILIGSPAFKLDGSKVLGQAEGGTLIRYTEVNQYNLSNKNWIVMQLHTAFHEYAHIMHQTFKMPDEYKVLTPNNYTKSGWQTVSTFEAIERGMLTPYATSSVAEDFAELFALYILYSDEQLGFILNNEPLSIEDGITEGEIMGVVKRNEGRRMIRQKLSIMKKFLSSVGLDIDKVREACQNDLANL